MNRSELIANAVQALPPPSLSMQGGYMKGENHPAMQGWMPPLRENYQEVRTSWQRASSRANDTIKNSGFIAGAVDQAVASVVGSGLRLRYKPMFSAMDLEVTSPKDADQWVRSVEDKFNLWAKNPMECDAEGRKNFGQLQAQAYRTWIPTGEILAAITAKKRIGWKYETSIRLLPSWRIEPKEDEMARVYHGVKTDLQGEPISLFIKKKPAEMGVEVPIFDKYGRKQLVHVFDGGIGALRGISVLTPALLKARQFDQLQDATTTAATLAAIFVATIESEAPTVDVMKSFLTPKEIAASTETSLMENYLAAIDGYKKGIHIDLGQGGRVVHTAPGEELKFNNAKTVDNNYEQHAYLLLLEIARCLGLSYTSLTGDYDGATYNSTRASFTDIFAVTMMRRETLLVPFCQAVFEAWLEEAIMIGEVDFPYGLKGFYRNRAAAANAEWKGMGKPQADDAKAAKAYQIYKLLGVMSDEQIADELGFDIDVVYETRAKELKMREALGLKSYDQPFTRLEDASAFEAMTTEKEGE